MSLVFISEDQFAEWDAKVKAQKRVRAVDSDTQRKDRRTVRRERAVNGSEPNVQFSAPSPYKSKLEANYAAHLELLKKAGEIKDWKYEPISLKLSEGKRYRPDFIVVFPLGMERKPEAHEVKGKWTKNRRDGLTHLKWAAQLYSDMFTFKLIQWEGHGFTTTEIGG